LVLSKAGLTLGNKVMGELIAILARASFYVTVPGFNRDLDSHRKRPGPKMIR
jgi:hypothetical protein